ncbi:macrophage migration inhibitory factor homolog [Rhopalosiphum maidis]|uniref:macrophage migration inhibitory factor homolog n=1 Tax=Rhopalosiphum maidis TaxID=43146 RepID=UPI00016FE528|nr:macrophage migration inhibitory factor homolog [Rhopalosiphum maidis]
MSVLRIDTNVSHVDIDDEFLVLCTEALAKTFQKPKSDILVFVNGDQPIIIAGSTEPAVIVSLLSVDGINANINKLHSAALFPLFTKYLKINENRITIAFSPIEPHAMGHNGKMITQ